MKTVWQISLIIHNFCGICCGCEGSEHYGKTQSQRRGQHPKAEDGRWEGRYTAGHDPLTGKPIIKNVLAKTQAQAKEKLKTAIEQCKGLGQYRTKKQNEAKL